jgi:hypothetical protein
LQREAIREQRFLRFVVMFVVAGRVPAAWTTSARTRHEVERSTTTNPA